MGHAFTLIELLVVVAVIAIMAALLLPALSRAKAAGKSARCKSNVRQLSLGLTMYVADFRRYPVYINVAPNLASWTMWPDYIQPYTAAFYTNDVYRCPAYMGLTVQDTPGGEMGPGCWGSYAYSSAVELMLGQSFPWDQLLGGSNGGATPESAVRKPCDMYALADARQANDAPPYTGTPFGISWLNNQRFASGLIEVLPGAHSGTFNIGFCDAHVEGVKRAKLFEKSDTWSRRWWCDNQAHPEVWPSYPPN